MSEKWGGVSERWMALGGCEGQYLYFILLPLLDSVTTGPELSHKLGLTMSQGTYSPPLWHQ